MSNAMQATPFFLVVSEVGDRVAGAVYALLRRRGVPVELVVGEELALARRWVHEVGSEGPRTMIELQDGRVIDDGRLRATFNRLRGTSLPQFARANEADQAYATTELHALLTSWLASLRCPVANAGGARGLSGPLLSSIEWANRAARIGLPVRHMALASRSGAARAPGLVPHRFPPLAGHGGLAARPDGPALLGDEPVLYLEPTVEPSRDVFVIGSTVLGAPAPWWEDRCSQLAREAGVVLLRLVAAKGASAGRGWMVTKVDSHPMDLPNDALTAVADWMIASASGGAT